MSDTLFGMVDRATEFKLERLMSDTQVVKVILKHLTQRSRFAEDSAGPGRDLGPPPGESLRTALAF